MHKANVDKEGVVRCRKCGSEALLAKTNERTKRTKHLKCEHCGEHQRYREPKSMAKASAAAPSGARPPAARPTTVATESTARPLARITWRPPDA